MYFCQGVVPNGYPSKHGVLIICSNTPTSEDTISCCCMIGACAGLPGRPLRTNALRILSWVDKRIADPTGCSVPCSGGPEGVAATPS